MVNDLEKEKKQDNVVCAKTKVKVRVAKFILKPRKWQIIEKCNEAPYVMHAPPEAPITDDL